MYETKQYKRYVVGFLQKAKTYNIEKLVEMAENGPGRASTTLGGRGELTLFKDHNGRKVAIKPYLRGGLLRFINPAYYWDVGKSRAELECDWLVRAPRMIVNTPEPLFWIKKEGPAIYKCWMGMYYLENTTPFVDILKQDFIKANYLLPLVCQQVVNLIAANVWHIDLHPGNVLIGEDSTVDIVDFDNASFFQTKNKKALAEKYIDRWTRACKKYKLPLEINKYYRQEIYNLLKM